MAPHVHRLSAYASQRLVSLFDMLSRKYNRLAEIKNGKMNAANVDLRGDNLPEDPLAELNIYTNFLKLVLEILNAILNYVLPQNPEVLDFFDSRIDGHKLDGDWSVEKVVPTHNGLLTILEREGTVHLCNYASPTNTSHPEEFFIPCVADGAISQWLHFQFQQHKFVPSA